MGNILTMAVSANAVLIKERLEIGAVYTTCSRLSMTRRGRLSR